MRKFFAGLLIVVALAIAVVLVGPSFYDWNSQKVRIAEVVGDLTGRAVTIEGDISLAMLPTPTLSASRVSLANHDGGSAPLMATAAELELRVALLPLVQGDVQVESLALIRPDILLEVLPDGRRNWDFAAQGKSAKAMADEDDSVSGLQYALSLGGGLRGEVKLENFTVSGGSVTYRDSRYQVRLENLDGEIAADSLVGPFAASGRATLRGVDLGFQFSLGRLRSQGASAFDLALFLPGDMARLQFNGALSQRPEGASLRGTARAEGKDLAAALVSILPPESILPPFLAQPFNAEGDFTGDGGGLTVKGLMLRLANLTVSGDVESRLSAPYDLRAVLTTKRLDLDDLMAPSASPPEAAGGQAPAEEKTPAQETTPAPSTPFWQFALPEDVTGAVELSVNTIIYRGQVIRQVLINGELSEGKATLSQGLALLPGGSDLSVTGHVETAASTPRFEGRIEAASDNLRALLIWLGLDIAAVPADRLRRMSLSAQLALDPARLTASRVDLRVDVSRFTGGVAVALRKRPGLGIGMQVDRLNLDAYLPRGGPGRGSRGVSGDESGGTSSGGAGTGLNALGLLQSFDANLNISLERMTLLGRALRGVDFDATLQNGGLTFRQARLRDFGGASGAYQGKLDLLGQGPLLDGAFQVEVPATAPVAALFGVRSEFLTRLQELSAAGSVKGSLAGLAVEAEVQTLGGTFEVLGDLQPLGGHFDGSLTARHPDVAGLIADLGGGDRGHDSGALELTAQVAGTPTKLSLAEISAGLAGVQVAGGLALDLSGAKPRVDMDLTTGELPLAALLAPAGAAGGAGAESRLWSQVPIILASLQSFDGAIKLRADAIVNGGVRLEQALVDAVVANGALQIQQLNGALYDGALLLSGSLVGDGGHGLTADLQVSAFDVQVKRLLGDLPAQTYVSGPVTINAQVKTAGRSEAELLAALGGQGDIAGTLTIAAPQGAGQPDLEIFGRKVAQVSNVANALDSLIALFTEAPGALTGTFEIDRGVVASDTLRMTLAAGEARAQALVDLPKWRLDSRIEVYRAQDKNAPYLTGLFNGLLDKPNVIVRGKPLQKGAAGNSE